MLSPHLLSVGSLAALGLLLACDQTASVSPSGGSTVYRSCGPLRTASPGRSRTNPLGPSPLLPSARLRSFWRAKRGTGTATHIGKYTIVNSHCVDPSTGALTVGRFVKTTANGDQLFGSYVGTATLVQPPAPIGIFQVSGTVTFTGGTGRFDGATGTSDMVGTLQADFSQTPVATQTTLTMTGTISY